MSTNRAVTPTLSAICPCPRAFSRPDARTATDTVRSNILTCVNAQGSLHGDYEGGGTEHTAWPGSQEALASMVDSLAAPFAWANCWPSTTAPVPEVDVIRMVT